MAGFSTYPGADPISDAALSAGGLVTPPKASAEFFEVSNTDHDGTANDQLYPQDQGRLAPVIDTIYAALLLPVRFTATTTQVIARGQRPSGTAVWTNDIATNYGGLFFSRAYWYDATNNNLYTLHNLYDATLRSPSLYKTNAVTGATTLIWTATSTYRSQATTHSGHYMFPADPSAPDTSDWTIVHPDPTAGNNQMSYFTVNSSGVQQAAGALQVDQGGTPQNVQGNGGYVTADKKIILSNMASGIYNSVSYTGMRFVLDRGPTKMSILLPRDGVSPQTYDGVSPFSGNGQQNYHLVTPWGDSSVLVLSDIATASTASPWPTWGRRVFDRADFDRWLNDLADLFNMPAGEAYF